MSRWIYRVVWINTTNTEDFTRVPYPIFGIPTAGEVLQKTLSELGEGGWEFTGIIPADAPMCYHAIFKQPEEIQERSLEQAAIDKSIERHRKRTRRK